MAEYLQELARCIVARDWVRVLDLLLTPTNAQGASEIVALVGLLDPPPISLAVADKALKLSRLQVLEGKILVIKDEQETAKKKKRVQCLPPKPDGRRYCLCGAEITPEDSRYFGECRGCSKVQAISSTQAGDDTASGAGHDRLYHGGIWQQGEW